MLRRIYELTQDKGSKALDKAIDHLDQHWADYEVIAKSEDGQHAVIMYETEVGKERIYLFYDSSWDENTEQYYCASHADLIGFDYWEIKEKESYQMYIGYNIVAEILEEWIEEEHVTNDRYIPHTDKDTYLFDKIFKRLNNKNIDEDIQDKALDRAMQNLPEWIRERSDELED